MSDFAKAGNEASLRARRLRRARILELERAIVAGLEGLPRDQWVGALSAALRDHEINRSDTQIRRDLQRLLPANGGVADSDSPAAT